MGWEKLKNLSSNEIFFLFFSFILHIFILFEIFQLHKLIWRKPKFQNLSTRWPMDLFQYLKQNEMGWKIVEVELSEQRPTALFHSLISDCFFNFSRPIISCYRPMSWFYSLIVRAKEVEIQEEASLLHLSLSKKRGENRSSNCCRLLS